MNAFKMNIHAHQAAAHPDATDKVRHAGKKRHEILTVLFCDLEFLSNIQNLKMGVLKDL